MSNTWDQRLQLVGVKNTSEEVIPPYAAMEISYTGTSGVTRDSAMNVVWSVKKPTSAGAGDPSKIIINGPQSIAINRYGSGYFNSRGLVLFSSTVAPTIGAQIGPVAGQWHMAMGGSGWFYKSNDVTPPAYESSGTVKTVYAEVAGGASSAKHAARLMASWLGSVVSCQIYTMDGVTLNYKETANVYDPLSVFAALDTDDWMYCTLQGGKYYGADPAGCPGTSPLITAPPDSEP